MYKLLIVDDEAAVREGLKKIIEWQEYGIEICGEAENGEVALQLVKQLHPNIIFTDIKMPVCDGISFIKEMNAMDEEFEIVVLSGFSDYDLVRQAMHDGAVDYILKPSNKDEIKRIIEEIIDHMEYKVLSRIKNSEHLQLLKNNILNRAIHNDISPRELKEKMQYVGIDLTNGPLCVAVIQLIENEKGKSLKIYAEKERQELQVKEDGLLVNSKAWKIFALYNVCNEMIEARKKGIVFTEVAGYIVIIFTEISELDGYNKIKGNLEKFIKYINKTLELDISIAVGTIIKGSRNLYKSYEEANKALEYQFIFGLNSVLFYEEINCYFSKTNHKIDINHNQIIQMLEVGNIDGLEQYIKKLFSPFYNKNIIEDCYVLRNYAMEIIVLSLQSVSQMPMTGRGRIMKIKENALSKIVTETSLRALQETIVDTLKCIMEERILDRKNKYSKLVCEVMDCIENNYKDCNLSLQSLSDQLHVNAAYLGRLFKKETNHSFTSFLNLFRVEKAKKLFLTTNDKATDISYKVGFSNYNYFYIVFRKIEGKNPTDFMK